MKPHYDVIIVGGRVAGAATGLLLSRLGHRVLIVDRNYPSTDTLSTHALMRTGVLQLQRWGVLPRIIERGTPAIRQMTLGFGAKRIHFDIRDEYGVDALYAPRRPVLDTVLLDTAVAAGAEFWQGQRMESLTFDPSGWVTGVRLNNGRRQTTVLARYVVGADGLRSKVAAAAGAAAYEAHPPANVVTYGYFAGINDKVYVSQFTPGYSAGFFPTNDGLTCVFTARPVAAGMIGDSAEFQRVVTAAAPEMGEQLYTAEQVGRFYRCAGIPGFLRVPGGRGWALVGDAGFTKDPLTAHGISDAFRDAELAAQGIDAVLTGRQNAERAMAGYQALRDRFAIPLQRVARDLAYFAWDEAEASALLRQLGQIVDEECHFLWQLDSPGVPLRSASPENGFTPYLNLPTAGYAAVYQG